jgi:phage tail protein X
MYQTHITTEGERWDLIAWRYYGDVTKSPLLVEANPQAQIRETLPSGLTLLIPIIEPAQAAGVEGLPPWKR